VPRNTEQSEGAALLTPAVTELRWHSTALLLAGLAFAAAAMVIGPPLSAALLLLFFGLLFGPTMYLLVVRRLAREAVDAASTPGAFEVEAKEVTLKRIAQMTALHAAGMVVLVLVFSLMSMAPLAISFASGGLLGMAGAMASASGLLRRWEQENAAILLREPRYRWRNPDGTRGGGILDPHDFFVSECLQAKP
jgi:hypothetical protein